MAIEFGQLEPYLDSLVPPRPPVLLEMEAYAEANGFPIIGPACGHLCYQIARMVGARRIFELGSGYGYSTAWFARAVQENGGGEVHHSVWDEHLSRLARVHLRDLGYEGLVRFHVGEAVQVLRGNEGPFDLIFNDIDKEGYAASLPTIAERLRPGGVLIVDNMLWSGRIFDQRDQTTATSNIRELTRALSDSSEWISTVVPIRDGLVVAYRQ